MLNREKHRLIMGQILRDIYQDITLAPHLGLKGGTCTYFFYGLPRFSVDLDFDLLNNSPEIQSHISKTIQTILEQYGKVKGSHAKRSTIFFLLSYGDEDHNIKVEISTRTLINDMYKLYEVKDHLGFGMLAAKEDYLCTGKLAALTLRSSTAMRDVFDTHFFLKKNTDLNEDILKILTGKSKKEYLEDCIRCVEKIDNTYILNGLGELLNEREKAWVRTNLKKDAIFLLRLRI